MVGKKHIAIDGFKLPSDASKQWSGTHAQQQKKSNKLRLAAQKIVDHHLLNDGKGGSGDNAKERQTVETLLKNAEKLMPS
ncbi:hypothetical protein QWY82_09235 [Simiduia curdlanivorans]|nr:hypothetical protein [Simiduia curdlanivorans]